jgi:hypothetical protein
VLTSVAIVSIEITAVLVPSGVTLVGEKVQVEYAGRPEQVNDTCDLKPPTGVTVNVAWPDWPCEIVNVVGATLIANAGATTVWEKTADVEPV